jgi:4-hydroxymandelate oxidase
MNEPINVSDFQALARDAMEQSAYDYYAGGACDEVTLGRNERAFDRYVLRPRMLVDVSRLDTATEILGTRIAMPILLAPTAFNRLAHDDGEKAAARAAGRAGIIMTLSTLATCTLEEVAAEAAGALWFQLYVYKDREYTRDLVTRAEESGYKALVLTVDSPVLGRRERDVRNRFVLPEGVTVKNLEHSRIRLVSAGGWTPDMSFAEYIHRMMDPTLTWDSVAWLASITSLPVLIKGVLVPEDAVLARDAGASGIVVSNHGGRQLDGAEATIVALPRIMDALGDSLPVLMDGGIRRGTDVLKALGLGARAVLIGRPYLWGLAAAGEEGVLQVLGLLRRELELAMALAGRPTIASIDRSVVAVDGDR